MTYKRAWDAYLERHLKARGEAAPADAALSEDSQRALIERLGGGPARKGEAWMFPEGAK